MSFRCEQLEITLEGKIEGAIREAFLKNYLKFPGNDSSSYGQAFQLDPWEKEVWYDIFGTGEKNDLGQFIRRYNRCLIGVPRGVGKTVLASAMILAEATANPVINGQYGLIADSTDNALNAFNTLASLIRMSAELSAVWKVFKKEIVNVETGARISVFPNKVSALQGWHFNFCICDELHVYKNEAVWEAVVSGQRNIQNAIAIGITTAGSERAGFLWNWLQRLREGADPECYYYWVGLDDDDDSDDHETWRKVMISDRITMREMEKMQHGLSPRSFERYQLNRFPMDAEDEPFMSREDVQICEGGITDFGVIDPDEWFVVGIDGAVRGDTLAIVAVQQQPDGAYATKEWVWDETDRSGVYSLIEVGEVIEMLASANGRPLIICDPARMQMLKNWLYNNRDIELYNFSQTPKQMCPASELLATYVRKHQIDFSSAPVLAQHCINAVTAESKAYGRRLSSNTHSGSKKKYIDAAVACAMALASYENNLSEHTGSYGVLSIAV